MSNNTPQIPCPLSELQLLILNWVSKGLIAREIAMQLGYAARTIENQLAEARSVMEARNTTHLVAMAKDAGWM